MALTLRIVTPTRLLVDAEVSEITAPGTAGEFGVFPEHVTFLGELDLGVLRYTEGGSDKSVVVHGGFAEVRDDVVTVLADDAEFAEEIDVEAARAELGRLGTELDKGREDPAEVADLLREHRRAEARIQAAS
ncbi:MAG: ATP synthase F1 subunit epsilon [Candidatus Binatia bacterium]